MPSTVDKLFTHFSESIEGTSPQSGNCRRGSINFRPRPLYSVCQSSLQNKSSEKTFSIPKIGQKRWNNSKRQMQLLHAMSRMKSKRVAEGKIVKLPFWWPAVFDQVFLFHLCILHCKSCRKIWEKQRGPTALSAIKTCQFSI